MDYLLETNTISEIMSENERVIQKLKSLSETDGLKTSIFTYGEIYYGISILPEGKKRARIEDKANAIFSSLPIIEADVQTAKTYFEIKALLKRKGRPFDKENDLWIAAVARRSNSCLVTSDKHFKEVEGLLLEDWLE